MNKATDNPPAPKAFISYAWSSPMHETWVLSLASRLMEDGVEVVLDKWDLKPGHDAFAFMESMVTDATVTKVVMICDKVYAEKADGRAGGVGAEAQILTAQLYGKTSQDRYAAIVTETDDEDKAYLPTYYKGRIHFDFSRADREEVGYEELLRWLHNKPLYIKPKIGTRPDFLVHPTVVTSAVSSKFRRSENALKQNSSTASGLLREYGEALISELRTIPIQRQSDREFDEITLEAIDSMRLHIRQLASIVQALARFDGSAFSVLLSIYEKLGSLMFHGTDVTSYYETDLDAFKAISYEAFLVLIATLLAESRFDLIAQAVRHPYLVKSGRGARGPATSSFDIFCTYVETFRHRNQRLKLNRKDLQADSIHDSHKLGSPSFDQIMEADFLLCLKASVPPSGKERLDYYPRTLIYAGGAYRPLDLFARSESRSFLNSWFPLLFPEISLDDFKKAVKALAQEGRQWFGYNGFPATYLANLEHLGSRE